MSFQNTYEQSCRIPPHIETGVVTDHFKAAERQRTALTVTKEEPVKHLLDRGVGLIDKQVKETLFDGQLAAQRVALNVAGCRGIVRRPCDEPVHAVDSD